MRFVAQQHMRAAQLLDDKAKVAIGKQKALLGALAAAHRIRAKQLADQPDYAPEAPRFDRHVGGEALLFFRAAIAHLPWDQFQLATLVPALVAHLASLGMDADEIQELKPYVREFTRKLIAGRRARSSMHQAAARYWNAIADSQSLKTEWARQIFPLPQEDMNLALENEEKRLIRETSNPVLASAYLKVMPLLWESAAISNYLKDNPGLRAAMPPIESIAEAIIMARNDFRLTSRELMKLAEMLKEPPTPNRALSLASSIIRDYMPAVKQCRYQAETPRIAKALFRLSFHPEILVRVIADSDRTTMELTSSESIFAPQFTYNGVVAPNCAAQFWSKVDAMLAVPFNSETRFGLDGATIRVDCQTPSGRVNFEVWSPDSTTDAGRLVGLIYDLAWKASSTPSAIVCLENLHQYLRD